MTSAKEIYYNRRDRSGMMIQPEDEDAEDEVAALVGQVWDIEAKHYPRWHVLDWFAIDPGGDRVMANFEFKGRHNNHDDFSTVFLPVHKLVALQQAWWTLGVPGFFVVRWDDGVCRYLNVAYLHPGQVYFVGPTRLRGSEQKLSEEPCLKVVIETMTGIGEVPDLRSSGVYLP